MDVSLVSRGSVSARGGVSLHQNLTISVLDPKVLWKDLVSVELLDGSGLGVCEAN